MKTSLKIILLSVALFGFAATMFIGCEPEKPIENIPVEINTTKKATPIIPYQIVKTYPHDSSMFTEGFFFHNGQLFESSGAPENIPYTKSVFGIVDLNTGKLDRKGELDRNVYFGEGITILNNTLYMLTYTNQVGFMYDAKTFKSKGTFGYFSKQGWGLTTDGKQLIMSDGTNAIVFLDPNNYQVAKTIMASENNYAIDHLNELEYINGFIYANLWMQNFILKINPEDGEVVAKLDLADIISDAKKQYPGSLELNGIAYDSISDKILVTGKMWPKIYEIKFVH
jgi:glutaminyl-peptide cyclotransferase